MYRLLNTVICCVCCLLGSMAHTLAQPIIIKPETFNPQTGTSISSVRVLQTTKGSTEATVVIQYSYDGSAGPTAQILPVIEKRNQKGVSAWFGANAQTIGAGRGTVSIKARYFADEEGAPAELTTDRIRVLILNQTGNMVLYSETQGKKIQWGNLAEGKSKTTQAAKEPDQSISSKPEQSLPREKAITEERTKKPKDIKIEKTKPTAPKRTSASDSDKKVEEKAPVETVDESVERKAAITASTVAPVEQVPEKVSPVQESMHPIIKPDQVESTQSSTRLIETQKQKAVPEAIGNTNRISTTVKKESKPEIKTEQTIVPGSARVTAQKEESQQAMAKKTVPATSTPAKGETKMASQAEPVTMAKVSSAALKTRITNLDIVNRSLDRSKVTVGVEFEYLDDLSDPFMGVYVSRTGDAPSSGFFKTTPVGIGKSRRNFILVPVSFDSQAAHLASGDVYYSDRLTVFIEETMKRRRYEIFTATMLLKWAAPGSSVSGALASTAALEMDDLKQINPSAGYVTIRYNYPAGASILHVRIYASGNPATADLIAIQDQKVPAGRNLQLVEYALKPDAKIPSEGLQVDTVEIDLRDTTGKVISQVKKEISITLTKP